MKWITGEQGIVRGADTDSFDLAPPAAGRWVISAGLSSKGTRVRDTRYESVLRKSYVKIHLLHDDVASSDDRYTM